MSSHSLRPPWITALLLVGSCILLLAACSSPSNQNADASPSISPHQPAATQQRSQQPNNGPTLTPTASSESTPLQTATGTIQPLEVTAFMYGTHGLFDKSGKLLYALSSHTVDLSAYIGKQVEVTGTLAPGFPLDGGPPYLKVSSVQEI